MGDVAAANCQSLLTVNANNIYNISNQTETSVNTLIEYLGKVAGKEVTKVYGPLRDGDIYKSSLSNAAARQNLSWKPCMPLIDGLARTYDSLI